MRCPLNALLLPLCPRCPHTDVNPASTSRNLIFLSFNGMRDGMPKGKDHCVVCFEPGKWGTCVALLLLCESSGPALQG